jgi:hypothetical protein
MASKTKTALQSLTLWGTSIAGAFGFLLPVVKDVVESGALPAAWQPYAVGFGSFLALIGRLRTTAKISGLF